MVRTEWHQARLVASLLVLFDVIKGCTLDLVSRGTSRRSDSMPHPRATALFAKTIYRELKRASYERADFVRLLADLMELVSADNNADLELDRHLVSVVDPETGLPNPRVADELIDFEIKRAAESRSNELLVFMLKLTVPEWCPDDVVSRLHVRTASALRRRLRSEDTVVRIDPHVYLALLPHTNAGAVEPLCTRLASALYANRRDDDEGPFPRGARYEVRALAWNPDLKDAKALIEACSTQPATPLLDFAPSETSAPSIAGVTAAPSPPSAPATPVRRSPAVVLALGGGAVRAAAHVGVMRVLAEAGIEIRGIAGTSAGALVGAMRLLGMEPDAILERFESFAASACYRRMRRLYAMYLRRAKRTRTTHAFFRQSGWATLSDMDVAAVPDDLYAEFIEFFVGPDRDIATLPSPFAATATDLVDGRPSILSRGPLHAALRATCAVPGLFAPQHDNGRLLVDGAVVADVPISAALHLQLDAKVLALYLERPSHRVASFSTSAEVLTRASSLVHTELVREQLRRAPILITAQVAEIGWLDFRRARGTAMLGEAAAREALDDLLAELRA